MAKGNGGVPANDNFKLQKDSGWLTPFDQEQLPSPGGSLGGYPVANEKPKGIPDPLGIAK